MSTVLLVDGYNIIGAWPQLVRLKDQGDMEGAREQLVRDLIDFSHFRGWEVVVVFDAYGTTQALVREEAAGGLQIFYTAQFQTADTFIEQYSLELLRSGCEKLWVATSDRAQQILVQAQGAYIFSAERLGQEVHRAQREQQQHRSEKHSRKGRTLADRLDPKTRAQLLKLQQQLP
ncbi:NYN domain-containing protein [Anthocerotibacter panamensis]|uniref:NYN domain-containing protein n=1 Tax=Anthocerotibacter panamensis TaxID=2857077 RepID=UPI001C4039B4|nr:NYN domain-containing protein [Anthocerotibacter panamensis]